MGLPGDPNPGTYTRLVPLNCWHWPLVPTLEALLLKLSLHSLDRQAPPDSDSADARISIPPGKVLAFPTDSKAWQSEFTLKVSLISAYREVDKSGFCLPVCIQTATTLPRAALRWNSYLCSLLAMSYSRNRFESLVLVFPWRKKKKKKWYACNQKPSLTYRHRTLQCTLLQPTTVPSALVVMLLGTRQESTSFLVRAQWCSACCKTRWDEGSLRKGDSPSNFYWCFWELPNEHLSLPTCPQKIPAGYVLCLWMAKRRYET